MALTMMKVTETLAIAKVSGVGATTINLSTDLLSATQIVTPGGTLKVGIGFLNWAAAEPITIVRNSVEVYKLHLNANEFDLSGNGGMLDLTESASNIVVTIGASGGVCFLTLRKMDGYSSKVEPWKFGSYDNTSAVGS